MYTLLKQRLNENDCRNRGYILDGFPRTFEDAQECFLKWEEKKDEEGNEIDDPNAAIEPDQKKDFSIYIKDEVICPDSFVCLKQSDQFLI